MGCCGTLGMQGNQNIHKRESWPKTTRLERTCWLRMVHQRGVAAEWIMQTNKGEPTGKYAALMIRAQPSGKRKRTGAGTQQCHYVPIRQLCYQFDSLTKGNTILKAGGSLGEPRSAEYHTRLTKRSGRGNAGLPFRCWRRLCQCPAASGRGRRRRWHCACVFLLRCWISL